MKAISFRNVSKSFGKVAAVDNTDLNIEVGQIFGFLGPNGAGKTTSIRCLMDFIHPDAGSIKILGLDSQESSVELKTKVGYLSADNHLYLDWTGRQHITFVENIRGVGDGAEKLIKQLDFNANVPVRALSTGNKQKLAIILAFIGNPQIIVMDEPTQGLDPILQNQFYELVTNYRKNGGTIFMSSHNLAEVERLCDNVAIINKGKIVSEETLESLKAKSLHRISVTYKNPDASKVAAIKDAKVITQTAGTLVLRSKGDLNEIISQISKYPIKDLEITHANLDEIFLEHYHA